ncbi:MAG: hypothetical protein KIT84_18030 [Labilithrix sp.]|nr:hypothetical protein [Labilithrix sp.]MCW5812932.1 hypothetical protein [Labilithrix sp.]
MSEATATFPMFEPAPRRKSAAPACLVVLLAILAVELCRLLAATPELHRATPETPDVEAIPIAPIDAPAHAFVPLEPDTPLKRAPTRRIAKKQPPRPDDVPSTRDIF